MQKHKLPFLFFILLISRISVAQPAAVITEYINTYKEAAIEEMKRTGVPASITLAQGIHETEAGRSKLVLKSNNHFGIKCKSTWTGESVSHDDDAPDECFRKYADPIDSYKDHSDFLKNGTRYAFLFSLDPTDFEGWAHGLKKAGYATNPKYPQLLIKLIQTYNLQNYTLIALGKKEGETNEVWAKANGKREEEKKESSNPSTVEVKHYPTGLFTINDTKVIFVGKGTSYLSIAQEHRTPLARLFDFNDMTAIEEAQKNSLVFLQRKRKEGATDVHKVIEGETLHDIAQAEGIRLESLYAYNYLKEGVHPGPGRELYLRGVSKGGVMSGKAQRVTPVLSKAEEAKNSRAAEEFTMHTVQPKETIYGISKKYAVSVEAVVVWNDLQTTDLRTGQQLRINKTSLNAD